MAEQDKQEATQTEPGVAGQDPRVGDTWESMDPREDSPRRRVQVLEIENGQAHVENVSTRHRSRITVARFRPPYWRFIG